MCGLDSSLALRVTMTGGHTGFFDALLHVLDKRREPCYDGHNRRSSVTVGPSFATGSVVLVLIALLVIEEPLPVGRRPR